MKRAPQTLLAINNYFYRRGGAETVFFEHMQLFNDADWRVVPFAMQHPENLASAYTSYFVREIEYGRRTSLTDKLSQAAKVIYSKEAQRNITRLIEDVRPDIAHAHNVYHHISPSIFPVLKQAGIPTVMTAHDLKLACPAYKMLSHDEVCERCKGGRIYNVVRQRCIKDSVALSGLVFLETLVHRSLGLYRDNLDRIVVPSRFYHEKLIEWGWPEDKLTYIPNFVDVGLARAPSQRGDYFLYAGRLSEEKGLVTLIEAIAQAKQKLLIAGSGPLEQSLKQFVAKLGADVEFLGHLQADHLHRTINGATALVLPSQWYENAPMSILEGYILGVPVIGSRIGGIPELVREGVTGLLAEAGNVQDLAEKIAQMADINAQKRGAMAIEGAQWVREAFSSVQYKQSMLELYASLKGAQ
ncbi:glycosyltransferase [Paenochrobactrum sp. BZR 588]|uniref:glycosyltransferase n=1 Tax=unclassified Paenochrobactrum TaxID=2639760 RepID=UPI003852ABC7